MFRLDWQKLGEQGLSNKTKVQKLIILEQATMQLTTCKYE